MQPMRSIAAAREDRWAALMTKGQPGSPLQMPGRPTRESWLADRQASQFVALMTAGQPGEPSQGGCGGCDFDEPCDHCGTPRSDPLHQMADWATMVAGAVTGFWRMAVILESVRRGFADSGSESHEPVLSSAKGSSTNLLSREFVNQAAPVTMGPPGGGQVQNPSPGGICCCPIKDSIRIDAVEAGGGAAPPQSSPPDPKAPQQPTAPKPTSKSTKHKFSVDFDCILKPSDEVNDPICKVEWLETSNQDLSGWFWNGDKIDPKYAPEPLTAGKTYDMRVENPASSANAEANAYFGMAKGHRPVQPGSAEGPTKTPAPNQRFTVHMPDAPDLDNPGDHSESRELQGAVVVTPSCPKTAECETLILHWAQSIEKRDDGSRTSYFTHSLDSPVGGPKTPREASIGASPSPEESSSYDAWRKDVHAAWITK